MLSTRFARSACIPGVAMLICLQNAVTWAKGSIRLYGIDAPESGQTCKNGEYVYRCGQEAALALAERISGETIGACCVGFGVPMQARAYVGSRKESD